MRLVEVSSERDLEALFENGLFEIIGPMKQNVNLKVK